MSSVAGHSLDDAAYRQVFACNVTFEAPRNAVIIPVANIAIRLGYADARSFRTAFKRWAGVAPGAYRQALRQDKRGLLSAPDRAPA